LSQDFIYVISYTTITNKAFQKVKSLVCPAHSVPEKTTLIKILTGQLDVTSGTPTIHGIDSAKLCGSDYKKA